MHILNSYSSYSFQTFILSSIYNYNYVYDYIWLKSFSSLNDMYFFFLQVRPTFMSLLGKEFCNTLNEYKLIFACAMNCVAIKKLFQTLLMCDELCC